MRSLLQMSPQGFADTAFQEMCLQWLAESFQIGHGNAGSGRSPRLSTQRINALSRFCQLSRHFDFLQLAVYTHPSKGGCEMRCPHCQSTATTEESIKNLGVKPPEALPPAADLDTSVG